MLSLSSGRVVWQRPPRSDEAIGADLPRTLRVCMRRDEIELAPKKEGMIEIKEPVAASRSFEPLRSIAAALARCTQIRARPTRIECCAIALCSVSDCWTTQLTTASLSPVFKSRACSRREVMNDEKGMPSAILRGRSLRLLFGDQWPDDLTDVAIIRQTYISHLFFSVQGDRQERQGQSLSHRRDRRDF